MASAIVTGDTGAQAAEKPFDKLNRILLLNYEDVVQKSVYN